METIKIPYYPGCTLASTAKHFEESARYSASMLGFSMEEVPDWTCCGASFPLANDNIMGLAGPANVLIKAKEECLKDDFEDKVVTLCSVCFNVLKRTNYAFNKDKTKLDAVNGMLEAEYKADTNVVHYLEVLRDYAGYDTIKTSLKVSLKGLKVAPYYGCFLLRPHEEIGLDDPYAPTIFEDMLESLGCEVVDFSHKVECCGSYSVMKDPDNATECSHSILDSVNAADADIIAAACPLCQYNLDEKQRDVLEKEGINREIPVVYFTQLLAIALGMDVNDAGLNINKIDPVPIFKAKGLA